MKKAGKGHWAGDRKQTTLWQISSRDQDADTVHGTQKPVECMRRPMLNNSSPGQAVYEPFMGSGTTLIAAETTGRVCLGIELNPAYVDVAVERWQRFTGKAAVLEGWIRRFDDLRAKREKDTFLDAPLGAPASVGALSSGDATRSWASTLLSLAQWAGARESTPTETEQFERLVELPTSPVRWRVNGSRRFSTTCPLRLRFRSFGTRRSSSTSIASSNESPVPVAALERQYWDVLEGEVVDEPDVFLWLPPSLSAAITSADTRCRVPMICNRRSAFERDRR